MLAKSLAKKSISSELGRKIALGLGNELGNDQANETTGPRKLGEKPRKEK